MFQDIDGNKNLMAIFIVGIYNSLALALGYDLQEPRESTVCITVTQG